MEKKNKRHNLLILIGFIVVIGIIGGLSYAFFNYTRTGSANTVRTGRIYFNHEQGEAINLTNVFPVDVTNGIPNNNSNVGSVTINVLGDTSYSEGIEYLVSVVNVNNTVGSGNNQKTVPISIDVGVTSNTNNDPATTLGTADESYFANRGGESSVYKVLAGDTITKDGVLLAGYIAPGSTGVDGNIVIRAYIDKAKVAISDTYPEGNVTINNQTYYNGTTSNWAGDRVVLTTSEWNSLQSNGLSFKVKVEANEGIWIEDRYTKNYIKEYLFAQSGISEISDSVTEIYFVNMTEENINTHSNLIDLKDTSKTNPGVVKAWTETDPTDNTKKILYIASPGMTYFPANSSVFFRNFSSLKKVEFNNVDTSEVTSMNQMFTGCSSLTEIDMHDFGSDNLTSVMSMFTGCTSLKKVNMSGFNFGTSDLATSASPLSYSSSIEEIDLSNATSKTNSLYRSMCSCPNLKTVDMTNFYAPNVTNLKSLFDGDGNLVTVKFENVRLSNNLQYMDYMFNNCSSLTSIDLSSLNTSNVDDMTDTFSDCNSLTKIYVSSSWSTSSVAHSSGMFYGCSSLVGGANTSFENNNPTDVTYAHIDGGQTNPGYLTNVSQKPSS